MTGSSSPNLADLPIAEHVKQAAATSMDVRRQTGRDLQPMLHLVMPSGGIHLVALVVQGSGREIAHAARQAILRQKPAHAVLITEGWTTRKDLPIDDPDYRAIIGGAFGPSKLPPHKRGEQLSVLGESANGDEAYALYYIEQDGSFSETMASWNVPEEELFTGPTIGIPMSSRKSGIVTHFRPMFLDHDLVRSLDPNTRAVMVEWLGSEKKLLHLANRTALKFLQQSGPIEPRAYTEQFDRLITQAREDIGWRKGRPS